MPLDGLTLDLDVKMIRGGVKDRISYLYNRLKKVTLNFYIATVHGSCCLHVQMIIKTSAD